jgi:hypothetical protein
MSDSALERPKILAVNDQGANLLLLERILKHEVRMGRA